MSARILIIEDNLNNIELMSYILQAYGYSTLHAHDGVVGLEMAEKEIPDLILCDIQLPLLDGYTLAKCFKGNKTLCTIPLVAVTALATVGDKEKVLKSGFDSYIAKPITPETFVSELEVFLPPEKRRSKNPVGND